MYSSQNMKDSAWEVRKGNLNSALGYQTFWNFLIFVYSGSTYILGGVGVVGEGTDIVYQGTIECLKTKPVSFFI